MTEKTFSQQSSIPRLPIPTLVETTTKYLGSLLPIATPSEFNQTKAIVADFIKPGGLGEKLQVRLKQRDAQEKASWLESWWFQMAYLAWPDPIMVNSNWFILFTDNPKYKFASLPARGHFTKEQVSRASFIINGYLEYCDLLKNEEIPVERTKQGPLCMWQYEQIFGLYRVPGEKGDSLVGTFPDTLKERHICILIKDQVYKMPVYTSDGQRVRVAEIKRSLEDIVAQVTSLQDKQAPIGVFTGWNRPGWAAVRQHMLASPVNKAAFDVLEKALFCVALDDYPVESIVGNARNTFHGEDSHNRWFDKSIVVCISSDARAGMNGEHSPCDALIPSYVVDFARAHEDDPDTKGAPDAKLERATLLKWQVDDFVKKELVKAEADNKKLIADSDVNIVHLMDYGADFMKSIAKCSPDAYMQQMLQLAYYRIHKSFATVYETSATRKFNHGRTETCRSLTLSSRRFLETMESGASDKEKMDALRKATEDHVKYLGDSGNGKGCDRHLLGLQLLLQPGEEHAIFKDPLYAKSKKWLLSTSALSAGYNFDGTGFGAVVPDGYGMNYMLGPKGIKLGVESKKSCPHTDTKRFCQEVERALKDVKQLALRVSETKL